MGFGPKDDNTTHGLSRTLDKAGTGASLNQIRGISAAGVLGAGIPKQVTNVRASVTNANQGATSVVTVTFRRDPSDSSYSTSQVYCRGYNGNPSNVLVASGANSPISFVLNNTGESVVVTVQSSGNAGDAPLSGAPNTGIKLPQSAGGGYGVNSAVGLTGSGIAPALAGWVTKSSLGPTNLLGDATTSASPNVTVRGIQTVGVSTAVPNTGDALRYNAYGDSKWDVTIAVPRFVMVYAGAVNATPTVVGHDDAAVTVGTNARFTASGSEPPSESFTSAATASVNVVAGVRHGWGANLGTNEVFTYGSVLRMAQRVKMNNSSNVRFWIGVSEGTTGDFTGSANLAVDNPNRNYAMFRFSAGTDSVIQAVCGTSSATQTVTSTGVSVSTSASKLFEIAWTASTFTFFIDGVQVAQITTNIPGTSTRFGTLVCCDNKNTATSVGFTFYNSMLILR
jgi:hypothetical protein